ncbi:hypothetical protein [Virgibacillus phage Mimir87]|nr:hypothetical protein [Virgibacillus phage Mimir87]
MTTPSTVSCDKCGKSFTIKPQEKKHGNGIKETYFRCTHCNERYTAYVTDADIRKKQRDIKKLGDRLHTITDVDEYNKAFNKYKQMQAKLEPLMNELKNKI